jgi:predicted 3-demethylubiquinone-9 3-methyltransferase (glyoxalase superfamily)
MQTITTFLTFNNRAEEAVNLYTSVFPRSKILSTSRYGDAGPGPKGSLMSATFELEGQTFMALNGGPSFQFSQGFSLFVSCKTQEEIDQYTAKLIEGGGELVQCGWLRDRFGVSWQIIPTILGELLSDPDPKRAGRVMKAMLGMQKLDIAALKRAADGVE